ncbi:TonB-dependent receptor [Microbulbifer celer]|uniref:Carboxypeptidase regulatory-like domain-containing protein n=1 Tax=Microbulbifer celer TaxID=435905 RepID=A0ABW3UCX5_9GAMM|nr:TonB-dependent receptor [Microbulbifer celer]UFN57545.1 TonB-dependent receptor [Microbulbifer celer]
MSSTRNLRNNLARSALALAIGTATIASAPAVFAQSTTGGIYGSAPAGATVVIKNNSGFSRTITVDESGRYNVGSLPVGTYVVTAKQDGETVGSRSIPVRLGGSSDVSFGDDAMMETVTVVGGELAPAIDVSSTDTRVVLTAEQLERLPMGRSAENIALLAPGVNGGASGYFGDMVSFGGAGVSENAYYINGFLANDPLSNLGGFSLPYASVDQQETFTGGYGSKYGRSSGGVINQVGARGSNELEFGTQVIFTPKGLKSDRPDTYFQDMELPEGYEYTNPDLVGTKREDGSENLSWGETFTGYVSGALIQDKLFGFVSFETEMEESQNSPYADGTPRVTDWDSENNKVYAKLDWYITEDHLLEYTYMGEEEIDEGSFNAWDFETSTRGEALDSAPNSTHNRSEFSILNYTGYLTNDLTLTAMYGHGSFSYKNELGGDTVYPYISGYLNQDPSIVGDNPRPNLAGGYQGRNAKDYTDGIRVNLEWIVGDHTLTLGVDNMEFEAANEGDSQETDVWIYSRATDPSADINAALGVGNPGGEGYFVQKYLYETATSMKLAQDAYYLEDRWQVTPDVLLSLGLRNDKFTNYNVDGDPYLESDDQWAPRLGAAWDVFGDSSLKVYANAGRYYLAMPNSVAIRGASAATYTRDYYTYSDVNEDGSPVLDEHLSPGPVSANGEYGQAVDPQTFAPADLENMYQDEFILGFEKTLGDDWTYGGKFTFRDLKSGIDDVCDPHRMELKLEANGVDLDSVAMESCYMFNPGGTNTFSLANIGADGNPTGTRTEVTMSADDWGMPNLKREYTAIDLFIERPFDGKWEARVDYTYSKLQGNTEGQVKSEFGQDSISKTQDWDAAELMEFSNGYLANDRRHQLKIRGSYALTEELLLSANARVLSGMPVSCLGYYNPNGEVDEASPAGDPLGYRASYHTCFGDVAQPGKERTPWTRTIDMGLTYTPAFMDQKLRLSMNVFNLLNETKATQVDVTSEDAPYTVSNTYNVPLAYQTPRYVMLTASYDF